MLSPKSFRMRASVITGFLNVAKNVERVIENQGFSPEDTTRVDEGKGSWSNQELWMAAKIVSQFNFITAFELALKRLLSITEDNVRPIHDLTALYDALRNEHKIKLETLFDTHVLTAGLLIARASPIGTNPNPQDGNPINSLRDFCAYCCREAKFFMSRYAHENIEKGDYLHFIRDINGLLTFLDKVDEFTIELWRRSSK